MCASMCVCVSVCVYACVHVCECLYVCVRVFVQVHVCACMHVNYCIHCRFRVAMGYADLFILLPHYWIASVLHLSLYPSTIGSFRVPSIPSQLEEEQWMMSFTAWYQGWCPSLCLHLNPHGWPNCQLRSTAVNCGQVRWWGWHSGEPRRSPTTTLTVSSSMCCPTIETGRAFNHAHYAHGLIKIYHTMWDTRRTGWDQTLFSQYS